MSDQSDYPRNDGTSSATDDSSVGLGNRPDEFLEDTSPHEPKRSEPGSAVEDDGPPEEPGIDKDRDLKQRASARPDSEVPD
ncbi:hypothetical protein [Cryobacterium tepidiphilum]|uniref:Uncharacterized protein n=1 Tax=Cryobacterium tepidiphilum TaxID=2486026 RepID=A0A3M8KV58_9MICO|nr:hypothetical protein [Cryobacterium tepidiphilum]RNE57016.1 hypothetical protein EEJ31_12730 [Cryobacterium tepidiphilum]